MAVKRGRNGGREKKVTRYTYDEVKEPRVPETGHTALLPADEQVVELPMDNGWSKAIQVGKLPEDDKRPIVVDMDPAADPVLFWAGKCNRREVPVLPLQKNEIVSGSRIAQIIERARKAAAEGAPQQGALFADLEKTLREADKGKRVEFYTHDQGWKNKLICGDSLHVMESLLHYEGLRGKVQMIYIDPPYGIKYDSNFQQRVDSTKNEEKDQADDVLTIKAFRDTWTLGIHSYLSYLQERLYLCRELLADTGSVFFQINQENLHLAKALLGEVFGAQNEVALIAFTKTSGFSGSLLSSVCDYLVWFAKEKDRVKYRQLYSPKSAGDEGASKYRPVSTIAAVPPGRFEPDRLATSDQLTSQGETSSDQTFRFEGREWRPRPGLHWKTTVEGLQKLAVKGRIIIEGNSLRYLRFMDDFPVFPSTNVWTDVGGIQSRTEGKITESRGYWSRPHEIMHRLAEPPQQRLPFFRHRTDSENRVERVVDLGAAELAFPPSVFGQLVQRVTRRDLTWDLLQSVRQQFAPTSSILAAAKAFLRYWPQPAFLLVAIVRGRRQRPSVDVALRIDVEGFSPSAERSPVWFFPNMRVPETSPIWQTHESMRSITEYENLSSWSTTRGATLPACRALTSGLRLGSVVYGLVSLV